MISRRASHAMSLPILAALCWGSTVFHARADALSELDKAFRDAYSLGAKRST